MQNLAKVQVVPVPDVRLGTVYKARVYIDTTCFESKVYGTEIAARRAGERVLKHAACNLALVVLPAGWRPV